MAMNPFLWGAGGAQLTPEEIATQRAILAKRRLAGVDTSPVAHWTQGAARIADALGDVVQENRLNAASTENLKGNQLLSAPILNALTGGVNATPVTGEAQPIPASTSSMSGQGQPSVSIGGSQQDFINSLLPAAIQESQRTGVDPRIIVGQAALETGWGKSAPGNNYFGIKSHGQGGGNTLSTTEVINGQPVRITDSFRAYGSPADSVRGYGDFILQNPRYEALRNAQGLDAQLSALQASGYATDPNYGSKVGAIARAIPLGQGQTVSQPSSAVAQSITSPASMGVNPAVIAALTSPIANDQTKNLAKILLDRDNGQAQLAQKANMANQQRQQEIQQRVNVAKAQGIDPAAAYDDELWKASVGQKFAAPSTVTIGNNVYDTRNPGQPLINGPGQQPTSVQEYEYAKGQGYGGTYAQYTTDMRRAAANNTTINNGEGNKFYNTLDENNAKTFSGLSETGLQARSTLAQVTQLGNLLEKVPTGATAALTQMAGEYGIPVKGVEDVQAVTALINRLVPAQRQPGSGSMSDQDLALFKQSLPRLINQPGGNATIVNTLKAISQYQIAQGEIADKVANREVIPGTQTPENPQGRIYTPADARKEIANLPNPLAGFKPPEAGKESQGWSNVPTNLPNTVIRRKN